MSAAERERLEAIARPVLERYKVRVLESEHLRQTAQSMTRMVVEVLRRGCMVQSAPNDGLRMTRTQQWLLNVEWVWQELGRELGPFARHVLVFRLTRGQKTESSSFARIAHDITLICRRLGRTDDLLMAEAEALYRAALPRLVALLQERGIGCDLPADDAGDRRSTYRPWSDPQSQHRLITVGRHLQRFACRVKRRRVPVSDRRRNVTHGARV